jgi:hypothetical protein
MNRGPWGTLHPWAVEPERQTGAGSLPALYFSCLCCVMASRHRPRPRCHALRVEPARRPRRTPPKSRSGTHKASSQPTPLRRYIISCRITIHPPRREEKPRASTYCCLNRPPKRRDSQAIEGWDCHEGRGEAALRAGSGAALRGGALPRRVLPRRGWWRPRRGRRRAWRRRRRSW